MTIAAVAIAAALVASACGTSAPEPSGMSLAPGGSVSLSGLPSEVAAQYRFAESHMDVFREIPCFCGCEALDHGHLGDCFVRPDALGYEAHGAGCGVCLAEAAMVERLLGEGMQVSDIRAEIVATFGSPAPTPF